MAAGYFDFTAGGVLSAANLEDYCEAQSIMRFASTAARDAALVTIKTNGMFAYITGTSQLTVYTGTTWLVCDAQVTAWTAVTFVNSWANYAGYQAMQYRKVGDTVQARGVVASGTLGVVAFVLPTGFRPPANLIFAAEANSANATLIIQSDGSFVPQTGSNTWFAMTVQYSTI
jgi:hypothetical protein